MEVLNHDVVEIILEILPVKSLGRFKSVSKLWKYTIESNNFQERQLIHGQQSQDVPHVLFVTNQLPYGLYNDKDHIKIISSSPVTFVMVPTSCYRFDCSASCDGLVCLYNDYENIVINPTTRWHRKLPLSNLQLQKQRHESGIVKLPPNFQQFLREFGLIPLLGFGKDKFNGTYKLVWLYKKETITTCEVFDFSINSWRYVTPPSSCRIVSYIDPVYVDGCLHWLSKYESKMEVLSFDLHTETFQVVAKTPFDKAGKYHYKMCNMNNRLCVSETIESNQEIWLFNSRSKTWNHMHSIDLNTTSSWYKKSTTHDIKWNSTIHIKPLKPVAVLEEKNEKATKVMYYFDIYNESVRHLVMVMYDGQTKSYDLAFKFHPKTNHYGYPVFYFQSLISIL